MVPFDWTSVGARGPSPVGPVNPIELSLEGTVPEALVDLMAHGRRIDVKCKILDQLDLD